MSIKENIENLVGKKERNPYKVVLEDVCRVKKGERLLIIANPSTAEIAQNFYEASQSCGAETSLIFQGEKTSFDNANKEVLAAIASNPDVCFSISAIKLGKDPDGTANPYKTADGQEFSHIFDYLLDGKKTMRGVWTPGITLDMLERTADIDYSELRSRCKKLEGFFRGAVKVHVTAPGGTDLMVPVENRALLFDDGDFTRAGAGGNIPAGEVFISPLVGKNDFEPQMKSEGCEGLIVYDGSMTFSDGDSILEASITCRVKGGYVREITGASEAERLIRTITEAENRALQMEKEGKLKEGQGVIYKKNARNIGELGIGLNPAARITGNMLEDEKAFHTCHFAIGENYDNDAPSLIHLDGVVRNPTITLIYADGKEKIILKEGELQWS